jgi:hypothetical protein
MAEQTTAPKPIEEMSSDELRAELEEARVPVPEDTNKPGLVALARVLREGGFPVVLEEGAIERSRSLPAVRAHEAMVVRAEVSPAEVEAQREKIKQVMDAVMKKGVHYGEIPGVNKPTLLKPGAEVLAVTFRLAPSYQSEKIFHEDGHLTVVSKARLTHIPSGLVIAEGEGLCSSREKKYAYRGEGRTCPSCGAAGTIKKSKFPPRENDYPGASRSDPPGWYCYAKVGGCSANFAADDPAIVEQSADKVANPDLPDSWNTVLKMADKRALVAAILNGTAASDIFTQDVEDGPSGAAGDPYGDAEPQTEGPAGQSAERPAETSRWIAPASWAELGERLQSVLGAHEARYWSQQALEVAVGEPDFSALTDEQKADGWQLLLRVLRNLDTAEGIGDLAFHPEHREVVQRAFAAELDGAVLAGPPWALTGAEAEAGTPSRESVVAEEPTS